MADDAEFGPRGYLPQRAATRARKIVLREQMGVPWVLAAVVAAVVVLVAGAWYLVSVNRPPAPPYQPIADIAAVPPGSAETVQVGGRAYVISRAAGALLVFAAPADGSIAWCGKSRRLESPTGSVWTAGGALVSGSGESLRTLPARVHDGDVYVDPTRPGDAPPVQDRNEQVVCR